MSQPKPLIIPIHIDAGEAMRMLAKLQQEGKQATAGVSQGAKGATESLLGMAAQGLAVSAGMQAIGIGKQMLDGLAQSTVAASHELQQMAERFITLRDRARELAGVIGKPGNIEFTQEQLHFATETGFGDASKAVDYRTAFQGEANQYAGRFKDPKEFEEFEKAAARLGNQNNVPPDVMAKLAGMAIRTGPAEGQTSAGTLQKVGGAFKTMMAGSGAIGELAGQLSRMSGLVGEDNAFKTMDEAAVATRMSAETNLPEAYTQQTEMRTGVIDLATKPKMAGEADELGVTAKTTNFEAIKKLSAAQEKSGENMDVFLAKIFPMKRIRDAFRDSIKAYRNGVMERGLKDAEAVGPGQIEAESAEYYADPLQGGMLETEKAKTAEVQGTLATPKATIAPYMQRAKTELADIEAKPAFKMMTGLLDSTTGWYRGSQGMGYTGFEQMETASAMGTIRREAGAVGIDTSNAPDVAKDSQRKVEEYMAELVRLTKAAKDARAAAGRDQPAPLSAPTAKPPTR